MHLPASAPLLDAKPALDATPPQHHSTVRKHLPTQAVPQREATPRDSAAIGVMPSPRRNAALRCEAASGAPSRKSTEPPCKQSHSSEARPPLMQPPPSAPLHGAKPALDSMPPSAPLHGAELWPTERAIRLCLDHQVAATISLAATARSTRRFRRDGPKQPQDKTAPPTPQRPRSRIR